ncbi:MAG TPA: hypothetical protein PLN31_05890 [Azoarcus taiwanensis]|nr:hypothetical protein [Azoarcus taiwanensis]
MKKKLLMSAVAATLAGAGTAHAVYVNPDGLGQVLLYPYYTVQNEFTTAIHVVNTTTQAKAVKVRFLEGKNSQEVLDFNLYLSPEDVWTGVVINDDTNGARIISGDNSCIAPRQLGASGEPFRTFRFTSEVNALAADPGAVDRRREGYVEIIEMGVLTNSDQITAVTHNSTGVPANCATIVAADAASSVPVSAPTGGLFGTGHLISVNRGVRTSYDAVALDAFRILPAWTPSGTTDPSLASVFPAVGTIIDGVDVVDFAASGPARAIDAVSAVLTHATINNEYTIDAGRESKTDWVVTFPTKRFYVNTTDFAPFQNPWSGGATGSLRACHAVSFEYFDREEQSRTPAGGDFSPAPDPDVFTLCNEVNTLTLFRDGADVDDSRLFGAKSTAASLAIENGFEAGWMAMTFNVASDGSYGRITGADGTTVDGLATIGFAALSNVNKVSVEVDGLTVFSSYMGSTVHKNERVIVPGSASPL